MEGVVVVVVGGGGVGVGEKERWNLGTEISRCWF